MSRESRPDSNASEGPIDDRGSGSLVAFMLERSADDGGRTEAIITAGGTRISDSAQVSIDQVLAGDGLSAFVDSLLPRQPSALCNQPSPTLGTETIVVSPPDLEVYRDSPDGTGGGDEAAGHTDIDDNGDEAAGHTDIDDNNDDHDEVSDCGQPAVVFAAGILPPLIGLTPVGEALDGDRTASGHDQTSGDFEIQVRDGEGRSEPITVASEPSVAEAGRGEGDLGSPYYEPLVELELDTDEDPISEPGTEPTQTWRAGLGNDVDWPRTTGRFGPNLVEDVPLVSAGRVDAQTGGEGLLLNAKGRIDRAQAAGLPERRRKGHTQDHLAVWIVPVVAATVAAVVAVILWGSGF